jgi:acetate kinase
MDHGKINCQPQNSENVLKELILKLPAPDVVAHRIVHSRHIYTKAILLNDAILNELDSFSCFAPLHQPHNINGARVVQKLLPQTPQYGCFDTAFHAGHDELHSAFAIPKDLRDMGLRRYGFHGLSYDWISRQINDRRAVIAHLGSGASLCALLDGKSIDTTMGLTALDGLPMSTRTGSIDAGFILYLSQHLRYPPERIEKILYNESGLKGLSGITGDVKTLQESNDPRAKLALDYFAFKTAQHVAMMVVSLGGLDALVFTGGVGENSEFVRNSILGQLKFLPPFDVKIIPANEEKMIAIQVKEAMKNA